MGLKKKEKLFSSLENREENETRKLASRERERKI